MIAFKVPGQPEGKGRPRASITSRGKIAMYTPAKTQTYEQAIWLAYRCAGGGMMDGTLQIRVVAVRKIPDSMSKVKRAECKGQFCATKPDLDNVVKVLCDALNGVAYKDDAQVVAISAEKRWGDEPHVWVEIREV